MELNIIFSSCCMTFYCMTISQFISSFYTDGSNGNFQSFYSFKISKSDFNRIIQEESDRFDGIKICS